MKCYIGFRLTYLYMTLTHSKGQGQVHAHMHISTANILEMVKDKAKVTIAIICEIIYRLSIDIFLYDLDPKFKVEVIDILTMTILEMVTYLVNITIAIK